jgi:hypothetical protein
MDTLDPELQAMSDIGSALVKLTDEDSRIRVLRWVAEKYTPTVIGSTVSARQLPEPEDDVTQAVTELDHFVDLYDAVNPSTDVDRVLTGAYWLQVLQGHDSWKAFEVNKLLKDTGYGVDSISHKFAAAQEKKPALVRQMSKSGKTRQATKTYKLTSAGVDYIAMHVVAKA